MLPVMLRAAAGNVGDNISTDGLIAHYSMDNISGTTLNDETGTYNATITGAIAVAGTDGNALNFNGVDDFVNMNSAISGLEDFTISIFAEIPSLGVTKTLYSDSNVFIRLGGASKNILIWDNRNGTGPITYLDLNSDPPTGEFIHFCLVVNGSTSTVYINNEAEGVTTTSSSANLAPGNANIARDNRAIGYFAGKIGKFRYYNRALTAIEVMALYNEV